MYWGVEGSLLIDRYWRSLERRRARVRVQVLVLGGNI